MPNKTILFADDSATMRTIMEKTFGAEPYDVVAVPSGEAAIATAREIKPSIVIADAGMAGVSGYDVCKAIRKDPALAATPVVLMAGVSSPYDEARGVSAGVSEYVKKPFDTTQVIQLVGTLIAAAGKRPGAVAPAPAVSGDPFAPPSFKSKNVAPAPIPVKPEKPRPFAAPSDQPAKRTIEYGQMSPPQKPGFKPVAQEPLEPIEPEEEEIYEPEPLEPEEEEAYQAKPVEGGPFRAQPKEVQPIRSVPSDGEPIDFDPTTPAEANPFTLSTLAEMAQLDQSGAQVTPEPVADAIDFTAPRTAKKETAYRPPAPGAIAESVGKRVKAAVGQAEGVSAAQREAIETLAAEVIERVVWEVVPDLAEAIIKEELARLLKE